MIYFEYVHWCISKKLIGNCTQYFIEEYTTLKIAVGNWSISFWI